MLSIQLLDHAHTACNLLALGAVGASLYLYSQSFQLRLTPLSASIPVLATIIGIVFFHGLSTLHSALIVLVFMPFLLFLPSSWRICGLHALLCSGLVIITLNVDTLRYNTKQKLLSRGSHTLHGLVIDARTWPQSKKGFIVTLQITHIDYLATGGLCKFFVYTTPKVNVGKYYAFFNVTLSAGREKPELLDYARREHLLGSQLCPFLRTKKLPLTTLYSSWLCYWYTWREDIYKKLEEKLDPKTFTYLSALFFGNKNRTDFLEMRTQFTRWGLTHYLARSGLHISLLVSLWVGALRFIPIGISLKAAFLFFILCFYDQLSWATISFNRALWLWFFYLGSWPAAATATPLFGFACLTMMILLSNPWYAGCLDFQLSFFLTALLMFYSYYRAKQFALSYCARKNK